MSVQVMPEDFEPPSKGRHQTRPEIRMAMRNPGRWLECDWDPNDWKQPDSNISNRRSRHREVWSMRKSAKERKLWLRYDGKQR